MGAVRDDHDRVLERCGWHCLDSESNGGDVIDEGEHDNKDEDPYDKDTMVEDPGIRNHQSETPILEESVTTLRPNIKRFTMEIIRIFDRYYLSRPFLVH